MSFLENLVNNFDHFRAAGDERLNIPCLVQLTSIVPDRLYFGTVIDSCFDSYISELPFIPVGNEEFQYKGFDKDFGPYNLAVVYAFCEKMSSILDKSPSKPIVHLAKLCEEDRVNSAFLMGCYAIIKLGMDTITVINKLRKNSPSRYRTYRDASYSSCDFGLPLADCLKAIQKAIKWEIFRYSEFNIAEYLYYEEVRNGDLNWIVPDKLIAFCGPTDCRSVSQNHSYNKLPPEFYFNFFSKNGVAAVVRLNSEAYDARIFSQIGIHHYDLYFDDGTVPDLPIVQKFLEICENTHGVVAVHCKAGLGRTGTLIACYLMKHYRFTAAEAIAWIRICRPGSIIGPQQQWLVKMQNWLWLAGSSIHGDKPDDAKKANTATAVEKLGQKEGDKVVKPSDSLSKITCEFKRIELRDAAVRFKSPVKSSQMLETPVGTDNAKNEQKSKLRVSQLDNNRKTNVSKAKTASTTTSSSSSSLSSSSSPSSTMSTNNINNELSNNNNIETQGDRLNRLKLIRSTSHPNERIIPIKIETRADSNPKKNNHNNNNYNDNNNHQKNNNNIIKTENRPITGLKISTGTKDLDENKFSPSNVSGHHYNTRSCGRSNGAAPANSVSESTSSSPAIRKSTRTIKGNNQTSATTQKSSSVIITSTTQGQANKSTSTRRR